MNNLEYTISIQNNSNKIIGSSEEKFIGIGNGNLIKIGKDDNLYTITNKDQFLFIKNFSILDPKNILIDDNTGINLQQGDNLKITFKEYELLTITDIIENGQDYSENEEIKINNGELNIDIFNGESNPTILKISEVGEQGKLQQLSILEKGKYITPPQNPIELKTENGIGAKINLKYIESDNRTIIERRILYININPKDGKTYITLDYSLPLNLKSGKLSVEKSVLILDKNYIGPTERNISYQIYKSFTPYLNLPLMAKNTLSPDIIYNKALYQIDKEIANIKKHLNI